MGDFIAEGKTARGFAIVTFTDLYGTECTIQESSLATESAIWFGAKALVVKRFKPDFTGWHDIDFDSLLPGETISGNERMHLSQDQVRALMPILINFAETGEVSADVDIAAAREADLRAEVERCHARLEIDHAFTAGPDDQLVRHEIPMAERTSMPDGIECRDDTIRLQDEQIDRLRGLLDEALAALIEIGSHGSKHVAYGDVAIAREAIARITAKIGDRHD